MKLIGVGLPRTATLSQKVALEILGLGPCYHMVNVLGDLDQVPVWRRGLEGETDWEEVFGDFQSTVDWPGAFFYKELIDVYPDAKVLLSIRDGDAWERSMRDTIWGALYGDILIRDLSSARCRIDPKWRAYTELMHEMWLRSGLISGRDASPGELASAMERYNDEVQETVPSDRLLVWSPADGWEALCRFLDVPIPGMPFPHLNDSKEFGERVLEGALLALQEWRSEETSSVHATQHVP